jgi:hypothetical protein
MQRSKRSRLLSILCILFFGATVSLFAVRGTFASVPAPSWWNGQDCDATNYQNNNSATPQATSYILNNQGTPAVWNGVEACGPKPGISTVQPYNAPVYFTPNPYNTQEGEWQCTELVKRYELLANNLPSVSADGSQVAANYYTQYATYLNKVTNSGHPQQIQVGDVLSYGSPDNHTALVTDTIHAHDATNPHIQVMEQNASSTGFSDQPVNSNGVVLHGVDNALYSDGNGGYLNTVTAWITPRVWSTKTTTTVSGTSTQLTAVDGSSAEDVWAVGFSGSNPFIIHSNGSTWGSTNYASGISNVLLFGVTAVSSTSAFAVGENISTSPTTTEVLQYNGTSWSAIPSDSPNTGNDTLRAVSSDGSGDVWAVGTTGESDGDHALIEKYDSTQGKFVAITSPTNQGTQNRLYGVTVLASNEAWAVGTYVDSNGNAQALSYHYNGTSWSYKTVPVPTSVSTILNGVAETSTGKVYAVGYYTTTGGTIYSWALHWDNNSNPKAWVEDDSSVGDVGTNTQLTAVSAYKSTFNTNGFYNAIAVGWSTGTYNGYTYSKPIIIQFHDYPNSVSSNSNTWATYTSGTVGSNEDNDLQGVYMSGSKTMAVGFDDPSQGGTLVTMSEQLA